MRGIAPYSIPWDGIPVSVRGAQFLKGERRVAAQFNDLSFAFFVVAGVTGAKCVVTGLKADGFIAVGNVVDPGGRQLTVQRIADMHHVHKMVSGQPVQ